jgi:Domain of unknown function (DUF4326)
VESKTKARASEAGLNVLGDSMSHVVHCKRAAFDVYIGRPSAWGNPFKIGPDGTRAEVIAKYRAWLQAQPDMIRKAKAELRGKVLACWCYPAACHGDVLAEVANG